MDEEFEKLPAKLVSEERLAALAVELYVAGVIKFGNFTTKSGIQTPVYIDLRILGGYPMLLNGLTDILLDMMVELKYNENDQICGVPYTALPIATIMCNKALVPFVLRRKEVKAYGTKEQVHGVYKQGQRCLIIEDVVTSGSSIIETMNDLEDVGLRVEDAFVIINREQGGEAALNARGVKLRSVFTLTGLMYILTITGCIPPEKSASVNLYLSTTKASIKIEPGLNRLRMHLEARVQHATTAIGRKLLQTMIAKQSNLCVAVDLTNVNHLLETAEQVAPFICCLKVHADIVEELTLSKCQMLQDMAVKYNFQIIEDRKFADIGNVMKEQLTAGAHYIASWAHLVTAHSIMGSSGLKTMRNVAEAMGVFLVAESSTTDNIIDATYTGNTLKMGTENADIVVGFVCQQPLFVDKPGFLQLTPGVQFAAGTGDGMGQKYRAPDEAVHGGADIVVIGRGIVNADDPAKVAGEYQVALWNALMLRMGPGGSKN